MTESEKKVAIAATRAFSRNKPVVTHDEDNTLMEKPWRVKYLDRTLCYCENENAARLVEDAIESHNKLMGLMLADIIVGDKIKSAGDKAIKEEES